MKIPALLVLALCVTACRHSDTLPTLTVNSAPTKSPEQIEAERLAALHAEECRAIRTTADALSKQVARIRAAGYDPALRASATEAAQKWLRTADVSACPKSFQRAWLAYVQAVETPGSGFSDLLMIGASVYVGNPVAVTAATGKVAAKEKSRGESVRTAWQKLEMEFLEAGVRFESAKAPIQ